MRIAAFLSIAALLLAGCGAGSDSEQVESTVRAYLDAFAEGDGGRACEELTGEAFEEMYVGVISMELDRELRDPNFVPKAPKIETMSRAEARRAIIEGCPSLFEQMLRLSRDAGVIGGSDLESLQLAKVGDVRVRGDRAYVRLEGAGGVPTLRKVDGEWKIAKLGIDLREVNR
jgi:hypothetical protein